MGRFDGKVVIVTGSSSGIGRAALLGFAREGASVVLHGTNADRIAKSRQLLLETGLSEERFLTISGGIEKDSVQDQIIHDTLAKFGRLDVLVNNAGILCKPDTPIASTENFDYVFAVNLRAPFRLVELALPHLSKTKGNIINVSSITGIGRAIWAPHTNIYGMFKSALDTFTKYEAQRLAALGVRMNNINPGPIESNIGQRSAPTHATVESQKIIEMKEKAYVKATPAGRFGTPEELVPIFLLLADSASSFITGACWVVDGGMVTWAPQFDDLKL